MFDREGPSGGERWPMVRVCARQKRRLVLLSADWVRLTTHFVGRTILCSTDASCAVCEIRPARAYWYLPVMCAERGTWGLMELSASASADLEQKARFAVGALLSGTIFEASRVGKRSPLRFEVEGCEGSARQIGLREWCSPLMAIFGLPPMAPKEDLEGYGERVKCVVDKRLELAAAELTKAVGVGV